MHWTDPSWPHVHRGEFGSVVAEMGLPELYDLLVFIMEVGQQRRPMAGQRRCRKLRVMSLVVADAVIRAVADGDDPWRGDVL